MAHTKNGLGPAIAAIALLPALGCGGAQKHDGAGHGHHAHHAPHHHGFEDPASWSERWDNAERDVWQKPDAVLAALALAPDDTVADIGAGTGYFAVRLAAAVPEGRVYAVDVEPKMVAWLGERAAKMGLGNLEPVQGTFDDPKIPEPVDLVMLTNTYHHIEGRTPYFARLASSLAPGGRVAIVDYKLVFDGHGPPPAMRLAPDAVIAEMQAAGYALASRDEETLPRQYILVFTAGAE